MTQIRKNMARTFFVTALTLFILVIGFIEITKPQEESFVSTVELVPVGVDSAEYRTLHSKYIEAKANLATSEAYNVGLINSFHDLFRSKYSPSSTIRRLRKINEAHHLNMEIQFTYDKEKIRGKITDRGVFLYHKEGFSDIYNPNKVIGPFWKKQDFITTITVN